MKNLHIKVDDTVMVLSGNDKGKTGKVIAVSPEEGKAIVEGINKQKKHVKPRKQGETGGILDVDGAMYASKLALFCPNCNKGVRVGYKTEGDKKVRVCKKCGKEI